MLPQRRVTLAFTLISDASPNYRESWARRRAAARFVPDSSDDGLRFPVFFGRNQQPPNDNENSITSSLLTFLKSKGDAQ
jgi:hypothetical protein